MISFECPNCEGKGGYQEYVVHYGVPGGLDGPYYDCHYCQTTGKNSLSEYMFWYFWVDPPVVVKTIRNLFFKMKGY